MLSPEERAVVNTPAKDRTPAQKKLAKGLETSLRITWEEVAAAVAANPADHARRERLKREIYEIERTLPRPPAHAMALVDEKSKVDRHVRAPPRRLQDAWAEGRPPAAGRDPGVAARRLVSGRDRGQGRQDRPPGGAGEMADRTRAIPLTGRVIVNRLWQYHFGRGIVATSSDFGVRGEPPSHPELLDWLASELAAGGWRLKPLHRLMVTSATYRQSNRPDPKLAADDPENSLFGRMNRRRLDAEGVRDAMLAVSGELNPRMGGPGVIAPLEKEVKDLIFTEAEVVDLWPVDRDPAEHARRSLYLFRKRNVRYPLFDAFDAPDTQSACPRRATSTHALQALTLSTANWRPVGLESWRRGSARGRRGRRRSHSAGLPDRPGPRAEAVRDRASTRRS